VDLETFVAKTLRQIIKGVKTAQQSQDCQEATINPDSVKNRKMGSELYLDEKISPIEFDVAVVASEGRENKAGAGVVLAVFGICGQTESTKSNSSVSRIKFSVPIILPYFTEKK
jgi:hypothetical protein